GASHPARRRRHRPFPGGNRPRPGAPPALRHQAQQRRRRLRLLQAEGHWCGGGRGEGGGGLLPGEEPAGRHRRAPRWLPRVVLIMKTYARNGMDEEASNFVSRAEFQNITYWNHDTMPSAEDPLPRCFHWLAIANAMHKPVTAEDMANMSARQNQNS
uniref:Uncharacterized protein n=1 Tax=Aegilops tauschii subsp. strangulata TaxID=200361 RepID=A0A453NH03_AEGTS